MKMRNRNRLSWLLVLPAVAPVMMTLVLIVIMALAQSVGLFNFGAPAHFTLEYWQTILNDSQLWRATDYSLRIGVISAVLSVALALPLALWLRKPFPGSMLIGGLLKAPLMVHGLVAALLFINLISWQGFINLGLLKLGIISHPIRMQNDRWGTGVIILQVWKQLPYALLISFSPACARLATKFLMPRGIWVLADCPAVTNHSALIYQVRSGVAGADFHRCLG